jgi:hypothetical protein
MWYKDYKNSLHEEKNLVNNNRGCTNNKTIYYIREINTFFHNNHIH